jgi:EmrB/QacA subfamily drug resistance transporter
MSEISSSQATHKAIEVAAGKELDPQRWRMLGVVCLGTLMVILDATIINIALPHAQATLHISEGNRQWVVTAYTLTFGGLLLLGGRIADFGGRKRAFLIGLVGFAAASGLGGAAVDQGMLFTARAIQGAFGALLASSALSLLSVGFTERSERTRAFGVYSAVLGAGSTIGLLLGGALTEYLNWRWVLYINIPIAVIALILAVPLVRESRAGGDTRYDIPGAVLITAGIALLVYGFSKAVTDRLGSAITIGSIVGALVLIAAFGISQTRVRNPLLPLRVVSDRNRAGAFITSFLVTCGLFGLFLFLTYYFQLTLGYSALKTGFAYLPLTVGIIFGAGIVTGLMRFVPPRVIIAAGFLCCAGGLLWFSRIGLHTSFVGHILGPELLTAIGMAATFVPMTNLSLLDIGNRDSGVASGLLNATQQVGASIGTALLNTIAATATTSYLQAHQSASSSAELLNKVNGAIHGYSVAFVVAAGIFAVGAIVAPILINARKDDVAGAPGAVFQ